MPEVAAEGEPPEDDAKVQTHLNKQGDEGGNRAVGGWRGSSIGKVLTHDNLSLHPSTRKGAACVSRLVFLLWTRGGDKRITGGLLTASLAPGSVRNSVSRE